MREQDADIVRRALKDALDGLDSKGDESGGGSGSLVVVVLGGKSTVDASPAASRPGVTPPDHDSCHPGLEKFSFSSTLAPSEGTKPCFMEPERPCVNSGACEMRGY